MSKASQRILYGERRSDGSTPFWRMPTLWMAAEGKPTVSVAIESLGVLDEVVWFGGPNNVEPTVRRIADRVQDLLDADLSVPIIITAAGDVLDGAHRIAKAYLNGQKALDAVVLDDWPPPDGTIASTE